MSVTTAPIVVFPSLGCPCSLVETDGDATLTVVACATRNPFRAEGDSRGRLVPVPDRAAPELALELIDSGLAPRDGLPEIGHWADWLKRRGLLWQGRFRVPAIQLPAGRRFLLFDLELLLGEDTVRRPGSVVLRRRELGEIRVLHGTDVHVARRWDQITQDVARVFPSRPLPSMVPSAAEACRFDPDDAWSQESILGGFENPNRNLEEFIGVANEFADDGLLDAVLLTGDLVDFKFTRSHTRSGSAFEDTEWWLLKSILLGQGDTLRRLRVPVYTSTGNHDYRLHPYKLQIYGLRHCGVPDETTLELLRRTGQLLRFKYRWSDLGAVKADRGRRHSLEYYYQEFSPFDDYMVNFGAAKLVVLDSGPDVFCDFTHLRSSRRKRFLKGLKHAISEPPSNGLDDRQIEFLQESSINAAATSLLVVTHAPPVNPWPRSIDDSSSGSEITARLSLPSGDRGVIQDPLQQVTFEDALSRAQLDYGTLFRGQLRLLDTLRRREGPSIVLSGHTHWDREITVDKATGAVWLSDYARQGALPLDRVLLLQTCALAHLKFNHVVGGVPGYRLVTIGPEKESAATHRGLHEDWPPGGRVDWRVTSDEDEEIVTFNFLAPTKLRQEGSARLRRLVCWKRSASRSFGGKGYADGPPSSRLQILPQDPQSVVAQVVKLDSEEGYASFVFQDCSTFRARIVGRASTLRIAFLFEVVQTIEGGSLRGSGLWRHHNDLV